MSGLHPDDLFRGSRVRLTTDDPQVVAQAWNRWQRDSEMLRLVNDPPVSFVSEKRMQSLFERRLLEEKSDRIFFFLHTVEDDRLIGFINLYLASRSHGEAWLGMAIGDRQDWGRGYGSEALRLILRYAFDELNLHRVTLEVYAYNTRAVRAYEKVGFRVEGVFRGAIPREGRRHDVYSMGILRSEWEALDGRNTP